MTGNQRAAVALLLTVSAVSFTVGLLLGLLIGLLAWGQS